MIPNKYSELLYFYTKNSNGYIHKVFKLLTTENVDYISINMVFPVPNSSATYIEGKR